MNEIDLYSAYRLPATINSKKTKMPKRHKKRNRKNKWFFVLIILVFLTILVFVANAFANLLVFNKVNILGNKGIVSKGFNSYAIVVEKFEDKVQAQELSSKLQVEGAGGYINFDTTFEVIASVYLESNDAKSVLEKVQSKYENAYLKIMQINSLKLENIGKENDSIVSNALNLFKNTYKDLYTLAIALDTSKITSSHAKLELTGILNHCSEVASEFRDVVNLQKNAKYKLTQAKIDQVVKLVNNLVESSLISTRLSAMIKYTQVSCLILQNELSILLK